jgi:hypothetical protein
MLIEEYNVDLPTPLDSPDAKSRVPTPTKANAFTE